MIAKIQSCHTEKPAYVYIRQSTMGQVRHHQESTERQYALKDKALALGWNPTMVRILDRDLGQSGAQSSGREDFQSLVADVSMNKVGAVFSLEASRLARSCTDWHRLLELCALTRTLIIDEDGCYDPADFNDQLVLGFKGTMSQAELHFLRSRLQGGKLNKAKKGELRFPLPVGLCYDSERRIVLDPDQEVRGAIELMFSTFRETGTAYAVVQLFASRWIKFPKRSYGGAWNGKLIWGRLTHQRVLQILKNPSYAGVYVFGRYRHRKEISAEGKIRSRMVKMTMPDWRVMLENHHDGYISWEEFVQNQVALEKNQTNKETAHLSGPPREGLALLQGLLLCGHCGRRISARYMGNGGIYPTYACNWLRREGLATKSCLSLRCDLVDQAVCELVLSILQPAKIEVALKAVEELEHRNEAVTNQWQMKIQRAAYEADLAQRRYEEVDPANRLVAGTLERRWNEALLKVEEVKQAYAEFQNKETLTVTAQQRERILSLAKDIPRLWNAATTPPKERKRILRLLIKDVTVNAIPDTRKVQLHIRWQGGACEELSIERPAPVYDQIRYPKELVAKIRTLACQHQDSEVANILNKESRVSPKGKAFTASMIKWVRYTYRIPAPSLKLPGEFTIPDLTRRFGVSMYVIYYWIQTNLLPARKINGGSPYLITVTPEKEKEIRDRINNSTKLQNQRVRNPQPELSGGAL